MGHVWIKQCKKYMKEINLSFDEIEEMEFEGIKKIISNRERKMWKEEMNNKSD